MRIAVSYENEEVFQHFGQSPAFKFYDIENKKVTATSIEETKGTGHRDLIPWLKLRQTDLVLCGGIGGMAIELMKEAGMDCLGGVSGKADAAVKAYLDGTLVASNEPTCDCHDHH
jgi:predicted Fe-Mo cluster-binding NifX family protein